MAVKCPKCNADNPDAVKFCGECGTRLGPGKDISITKTLKTRHPSKIKRVPPSSVKIAGKYKILEELGRGGMGVVVKAKDTRLERTVALKFLPPELTRNEEAKKRFIQEAKAAAALEHPNICTVYEIDEADGQTFIAMSYIEGQSLEDKLKEGPMDVDEAKDVAIQVAEGLKEAHEKGIVHRDIKPANIMLTEKGQAKITDFGLAKLSWGADLTKPATIMGTVAYMSPEQARGETVDHRTDIWSLGAILYEMLSGKLPFHKDLEHALIYSILHEKPIPITSHRADIPIYIKKATEKALTKKVNERFQNINELIQDLKQSPAVSFPKAEKSIVVLPFDDLSPNHDQEYFSDGLTEEVISDLSGIGALRVISRSSAMTFKGTKKTAPEIAEQLNVQYVLEGSVRKAGNNLRITAQLIDAAKDTHLWAEKYSGTLDDVFDIQEKVSRMIVEALKLKLSPNENKKIYEHLIENVQAYECYLWARHEYWRFTKEGLDRALQYLQNGLKILGENELLFVAMGIVYWQYHNAGIDPDKKYLNEVEKYAKKIFDLNPRSAQGFRLSGVLHYERGELNKAVREYKNSLAIDPNNPDTLLEISRIYIGAGRADSAKLFVNKAIEHDPFTPINQCMPGYIAFSEGRFEDMVEPYQRMYNLDSGNPIGRWFYAWSLMWNKRYDEAYKIIDLLIKDSPHTIFAQIGKFWMYVSQGEKEKAKEVAASDMIDLAKSADFLSRDVAHGYAMLDEKECAVDWLENAAKRGFINYPFLNEHDYIINNLREQPRFKKFMERVKREWEDFECGMVLLE
jgi:serine/threonine protein kinase/Tfp pilus assembly protein PilF